MSDLTFNNATTVPIGGMEMMLPTQMGPFQYDAPPLQTYTFETTLAPTDPPKKKKSLKSQLMSTVKNSTTPETTATGSAGGLPVPPGALVAETLADFGRGGVDNSLVFPRGAAPEIDNITQVAPRHFRFELRMRGNPWSPFNTKGTKGAWYDGDRDLEWNEGKRDKKYHDKSRAEVNGLTKKFKVEMKNNETWDIATTVKLDANFVPSKSYCNIMQPVFDQSFLSLTGVNGDDVTANLFVFTNGIGSKIQTARTFTIKRGVWTSIIVRVKFGTSGKYEVSVNGDPFKGISLDTGKLFAERGVGNKWGLYATSTTSVQGKPMKDLIVEHKNIYVRKV